PTSWPASFPASFTPVCSRVIRWAARFTRPAGPSCGATTTHWASSTPSTPTPTSASASRRACRREPRCSELVYALLGIWLSPSGAERGVAVGYPMPPLRGFPAGHEAANGGKRHHPKTPPCQTSATLQDLALRDSSEEGQCRLFPRQPGQQHDVPCG